MTGVAVGTAKARRQRARERRGHVEKVARRRALLVEAGDSKHALGSTSRTGIVAQSWAHLFRIPIAFLRVLERPQADVIGLVG
jgi:hypothetical protein